MRAKEFRERLLIALYRAAQRGRWTDFFDPQEVAKAAGLSWSPGQLRLSIGALSQSGFLDSSETLGGGDDGGIHVRILQYGVEEAEELIEQNFEYEEDETEGAKIPASNRYVTIADNARSVLSNDLSILGDVVRGHNEADEEDRLVALSEIAVFEAAVAAPRLAQELIDRFVGTVLKWIALTFGAALVSEVALRLSQALSALS